MVHAPEVKTRANGVEGRAPWVRKCQKKGTKSNGGGKKKGADTKSTTNANEDKWAWKTVPPTWKTVPPKEGEELIKTVNGKKYHWCPNHKAWTLHTPEECKKKPKEIE